MGKRMCERVGAVSPPEETKSSMVLLSWSLCCKAWRMEVKGEYSFLRDRAEVNTFILDKNSLVLQLGIFQLSNSILQVQGLKLVGFNHPSQGCLIWHMTALPVSFLITSLILWPLDSNLSKAHLLTSSEVVNKIKLANLCKSKMISLGHCFSY